MEFDSSLGFVTWFRFGLIWAGFVTGYEKSPPSPLDIVSCNIPSAGEIRLAWEVHIGKCGKILE